MQYDLVDRDFEWSPDANIISYWVPELDACPARVTLIGIPSREELRGRNLFNVADCKLHWQKSGEHLCVKVDRYQKKKIEDKEPKYTVGGTDRSIFIFIGMVIISIVNPNYNVQCKLVDSDSVNSKSMLIQTCDSKFLSNSSSSLLFVHTNLNCYYIILINLSGVIKSMKHIRGFCAC